MPISFPQCSAPRFPAPFPPQPSCWSGTNDDSVSMPNSWSVLSGNQLSEFFKAYTELTALQTFSEMNGEGFRKIVKKYDKTMGTDYLNRRGERERRKKQEKERGSRTDRQAGTKEKNELRVGFGKKQA